MVRNAFKAGGWGFRFPGSGTFTVNRDGNKTSLQSKCAVDLGENVRDVAYKVEYITTDYVAYYPGWGEVRPVEAKTVRTKKVGGERLNARETSMVEYYYLTDKRNGKLVKSNFCIELERTWFLAEIMSRNNVFAAPVVPYFQVRFINAGKELFIDIPGLLSSRSVEQDVLKVMKDSDGNVTFKWQSRVPS